MDLEKVEKEIDGRNYRYTPMFLKPARKLLDQLVQRFGPALADAVAELDGVDDVSADQEAAAAVGTMAGPLGAAMKQAFSALDPEFHDKLTETLAKQTEIQNDDGNWVGLGTIREMYFATRIMTEFKWIWFCLSSQYADFLEPVQNGALKMMALKGLANDSRSTFQRGSTGKSGESFQTSGTA